MFEITADDIALLNDADLRGLVGRLCEAEMRKRGLATSSVTWGGDQDASDGGLDVRVELPATAQIEGWVPRPATGFQVKKQKMPRTKIVSEMRPSGLARPAIQALADGLGAYIIVSSGDSTSDTVRRSRCGAMMEAIRDLPNSGALTVDFYDRGRLATWVGDHPGLVLWVKEKVGRSLSGWRPYGAWADTSLDVSGKYLFDDRLRIHTGAGNSPGGVPVLAALKEIRALLSQPGTVARLVGLSGVGKTRLVQALFEEGVGDQILDPSFAFYANVAGSPDPDPTDLASQLVAKRDRAILVIDNCPLDLHRRLSQACLTPTSTVSVITVEYDIQDDLPEGTEVFKLDTCSLQLIEELVRRRFKNVSATDRQTIAKFSDGNARVAIALAGTVGKDETIGGLRDEELLQRLIEQRHGPNLPLLLAARTCSLVYSFDGRDDGAESELALLGSLIGQSAQDLYRHGADLLDRGVVQKRGIWRAVLPHAIANRLAAAALQRIPFSVIEASLVNRAPERMLKSLSRRLGYLHTSPEAVEIVRTWLGVGGILHNVVDLDDVHRAMFENVAPVLPDAALLALECDLAEIDDSETLLRCRHYGDVLRLLAYDADLFSRCVALLAKIAIVGELTRNSNRALEAFVSLFQICYSGTHAPIDQRLQVIMPFFASDKAEERTLGLKALEATLEALHIRPFHDFEFGARSRDYGYWPPTSEEVRRWFGLTLRFSETLACSDGPVAPQVRKIIADQLRGLWMRACAFDEIEGTCRAISERQFWPEGWIAVRQIQHYDGKGLAPELSARLSSLEGALRPKDVSQKVRSIVLPEDVAGTFIIDVEDDDLTVAMARVSAVAQELGESVAADEVVFQDVLPELVSHNGHLWSFGRGLARGAADPYKIWDRLLDALAATAEGKRRIQVLCGFVQALHETNPEAADELLDRALLDERSAAALPTLQAIIGIDERGVGRLMSALSMELAPVGSYQGLIAGGASDSVPARQFKDLVVMIASKPGGFDVAVDILNMKLHQDETGKREHAAEVVDAGRHLIRRIAFTTDYNAHRDYSLGQIIRACLGGDVGAAVVKDVCRRLKESVSQYTAYSFYNDDLIGGLFAVHATIALDVFCGGSVKQVDQGLRMIRDLRQNPLDAVPEDELFAWCDHEPRTRYSAIASVITICLGKAGNGQQQWTTRALQLLERAPERGEVLKQYIAQIRMTTVYARATSLDSFAKLLDELAMYPDPDVMQLVANERDRLRREADARRLSEATAEREQNERFE